MTACIIGAWYHWAFYSLYRLLHIMAMTLENIKAYWVSKLHCCYVVCAMLVFCISVALHRNTCVFLFYPTMPWFSSCTQLQCFVPVSWLERKAWSLKSDQSPLSLTVVPLLLSGFIKRQEVMCPKNRKCKSCSFSPLRPIYTEHISQSLFSHLTEQMFFYFKITT